MTTKNLNALLPEPLYKRLRRAAFEHGESMSSVVRQALEAWLPNLERDEPEAAQADSRKAG